MTNVAIIPARGGSKRIPRKNIRLFAGRPMIAYSIDAALPSNPFDGGVGATGGGGGPGGAGVWGAGCPFIRPEELS